MIEFLFPGGKHHVFTASFDDGKDADRRLVEIFNRYSIKATFNLTSGWLDRDGFVTSDEVSSLYRGHEVASHTVHHPDLTDLSTADMIKEIVDDVSELENLCGYPVRGFALPGGDRNPLVDSVVKMCGMSYSRTGHMSGSYAMPEDFGRWNPGCHQSEAMPMVDAFVEAQKYPTRCKMLYIMGHSYEFPRDNSWDYIEEICKKVSFFEDTWYATNIEIYDYYMAQRSLQTTRDNRYIHNPTFTDVWVKVGGEIIEIKAGQTVIL